MNTIDRQDIENNDKRNMQLHPTRRQQSFQACRQSPVRCWQSF